MEYQKANNKAWKDTRHLVNNAENSILRSNYQREKYIHMIENDLRITLNNTQQCINMLDFAPKKEQFNDAVSDILNGSLIPKLLQQQSSINDVDRHVVNNNAHIMDAVRNLSDKKDNQNTNMSQEFHKIKESYNSIRRSNSFEDLHSPFKEERKDRT
jgi:hypothetical protein